MNHDPKKILLLFVGVMAVIALSMEIAWAFFEQDGNLRIHFLDVGQGDATLVDWQGSQILIDGGADGKKLLSLLGEFVSPLDRQIEFVILTHPDQDHLAGLIDVLENYRAGVFLSNGQDADTQVYRQLSEVLERRQIRRETFGEGSTICLGADLKLRSFNPDELSIAKSDRNEQSVVLRMDFGVNSFLLTGDADEKTEKDMLADREELDVDWLKVGHHGSKHSSSVEFLQAATPEHAIISVGKNNRYGHPDPQALERLEKNGVEILRTDERGTITVNCPSPQRECRLK